MRAVIYCRVSTEEQAREGYSLQSQETLCRSYCDRLGYEVNQVFVDAGASAKNVSRPELQRMLTYCAKNRHTVDAVVVYKLDRLARNVVDHSTLSALLAKLAISLRSVTEPLDKTPVGKLTENIIASLAQFDNDSKGERTRDGMKQALSQGRWIWHAPIGYRFNRDSAGKALIIPDENAKFVKEAFELFSQGIYRQSDIASKLKQLGMKRLLCKQSLNYLLRNPLYIGEIQHHWFKEPVKAVHEPIVDPKVFWKVQLLLDGKKPTATTRNRNHPDFPLRNFALCPLCKTGLTGSWSKSQNGTKYAYYHCYKKGCAYKPVKRAELSERFEAYLESIRPSDGVLRLFRKILIDVWNEQRRDQNKHQHRIESTIKELEERKQRITDLMIKGTFDDETYREAVGKIRQDLAVHQLELHELQIEQGDVELCLNYCTAVLENPAKLWANADIDMKQRFQNLVFPKGITYEAGIIGTGEISPIFKLFQENKGDESKLAPRARLELATFPLTAGRSTIELSGIKVN